jgi:UPF0716 protein FxsA
MRILFLLFLVVPIVEMLVLIEVGSFIGAFYTVLLVLLTAIIGVSLLRKQGLSTFIRANEKMQAGQMPVAEMGEGLMLAIAGALLLTPGFVTDAIGFVLLTPGLRSSIAKVLFEKLLANSQSTGVYSQTTYQSSHNYSDSREAGGSHADIVDGEFQEILDTKSEKDS